MENSFHCIHTVRVFNFEGLNFRGTPMLIIFMGLNFQGPLLINTIRCALLTFISIGK